MSIRYVGVVVAIALAGTTACDSPSAPQRTARIVAVSVDSASGPLVRTVVVTMDRPAPVELTYGAPGTPVLSLVRADTALEHHVILPRLRAEREYLVQAVVPARPDVPVEVRFRTGALPPALKSFAFQRSGTPSAPVTLLELVGSLEWYGLLMVEEGEIVGYLPSNGSLFGSTRRANGELVLLDSQLGLVAYRLDGSIAHRLPQPAGGAAAPYGRIHHDFTATPHNTILFIANETRTVAAEEVIGEALWEWNPEQNTVVQRWSAFDHLDWGTERGSRSSAGNWLHANGVAYGPRGNVIVSLRNVDQVISIAPDFASVEWKLGGVNGTLQVDGTRFYGQHYATEVAPDRLLIFDNAYEQPGTPVSRAVEYRIERSNGRAVQVWEYRHDPRIYAALVGSAIRLPNGNTVVNFGMFQGHNESTGPITVVEVDAAGVERWRLNPTAGITRLYRATPVESLLGERPGAFRSQ